MNTVCTILVHGSQMVGIYVQWNTRQQQTNLLLVQLRWQSVAGGGAGAASSLVGRSRCGLVGRIERIIGMQHRGLVQVDGDLICADDGIALDINDRG